MSFLHRTFAHEYCVAIVGGCLLVATGVLGVLTAQLRTTCTLMSFFVCTIFCVALAVVIFALSVVGIGLDFARAGVAPAVAGQSGAVRQQPVQSLAAGMASQLGERETGAGMQVGLETRAETREAPRASEESWRKNALSIHCTQLAASVLALAVALVAAISCTKRVCCNPNVSFFENRVRVSLVLPQLLASRPAEERDSRARQADTETQTEVANVAAASEAQAASISSSSRSESDARSRRACEPANRRRPRASPYSRPAEDAGRVSLTLSAANRHMRAYYRCGMPIGPFFLNASDLPAICPSEERDEPRRRSRRRAAPTPSAASFDSCEPAQPPQAEHSARSVFSAFLRRRVRPRRREAPQPDNRIVYLYSSARGNELEGYVYPAPPPPYFVQPDASAPDSASTSVSLPSEPSVASQSQSTLLGLEQRPLLRQSDDGPPLYTTLDRDFPSRFRWLRSSVRVHGNPDAEADDDDANVNVNADASRL